MTSSQTTQQNDIQLKLDGRKKHLYCVLILSLKLTSRFDLDLKLSPEINQKQKMKFLNLAIRS